MARTSVLAFLFSLMDLNRTPRVSTIGLMKQKFWVYILYSHTADRYYCGHTDDIEKRISQHNDPDNSFTRTTHRFKGPWKLIRHHEYLTRSQAIRLERKIKKRGIKRYLSDIEAGGC